MLCDDTCCRAVKNLHKGWAVEEGKAIEEDNDPNESGRDEQKCVPAQPQVVQSHFLPKVVPEHMQICYMTHMVASCWFTLIPVDLCSPKTKPC